MRRIYDRVGLACPVEGRLFLPGTGGAAVSRFLSGFFAAPAGDAWDLPGWRPGGERKASRTAAGHRRGNAVRHASGRPISRTCRRKYQSFAPQAGRDDASPYVSSKISPRRLKTLSRQRFPLRVRARAPFRAVLHSARVRQLFFCTPRLRRV